MKCDVLIVAGLWNSGPRHWQSLWQERYPAWTRAPHRDWTSPERDEWVAELDAAIAACKGAPILVAHSLGCILVAHWARCGSPLKVAGAFLVAPSDVEAPSYPAPLNGFAPVPMEPLPFPSIVVASSDDPYVTPDRAQGFAASWGSRFVDIGKAGHLNADSGHGDWPEGERLLTGFCDQVSA
ncbi:alpha/beta hydrolase [Massilia sp. ST3]|uniref:RBBP9/YdeN family alpha/beta hydrolase n=1 Tax=Massilia sp. ST3 TaxID=2824903 RepID=UPI001B835507|nr:alpha/beta hydrolase [Massilia sp. ST3]MBQ5948117.1 alpha/beta hydrolase [Massilia sp. ST3]